MPWLHERLLALMEPDPESIELPSSALEEYVGPYEGGMLSLEVRLARSGLEVDVRVQKPLSVQTVTVDTANVEVQDAPLVDLKEQIAEAV